MDTINIGVLGSVDSGKSTLIGVLKTNMCDDGRGLLRQHVMKHNHELTSGRTSCISYNNVELNNVLFNFVDLAGHESYLKTTIYGLNALNLDCVIIVIGSNMGINNITKEHFNLASVLQIPIIFILNKIDLCPEEILYNTYDNLKKIVYNKSVKKNTISIINDTIENALLNNKNIYEINKTEYNYNIKHNENDSYESFLISNKTGYGIDNLKNYLVNYKNASIQQLRQKNIQNNINKESNENIFVIQETYNIKGIGMVFYGYVKSGKISKNDTLYIGRFWLSILQNFCSKCA